MGMKINLGRLLLQTAKQFSEREALINIERNRRFTYMELHLLTNKICNMMKDRFGMDTEDTFINLLENDNIGILLPWMLKGESSTAWCNYRDSYDEHMWQIDFIKPKMAFIENILLDKYYAPLRERGIEIICMDPLPNKLDGAHYLWELIEDASEDETNVERDRDEDIVMYRFTGGTTGKGKCAMYSINNMVLPMYGFYDHVEDLIPHHIRHLHITPLSHASALFTAPILFKGGASVTMNLPDLKQFCQNIQDEKITSTLLVPTILYRFLEFELDKMYDLTSLETVYYGASPMSPDKLKGLQAKFGNIFIQAYGATEAVPPVTLLGKKEHQTETDEDIDRLNSTGKPCAGFEIVIKDENGRELPSGETGEAWIRGPGVIKGYYKNPEQTGREFTGDGFWKSGDMGYLDKKGYFYIVDRKKDMIITGGFNVYAIEVEDALNSHDAVLMSAVVGIPHEEWGEAIHAEVILKEGAQVKESELIEFCKGKKGKYKAPKSIAFVSELPITVVGKILRKNVREKYWKDEKRGVH